VVHEPSGVECGTIAFNSDEEYETAYAWQYGGVVAPYYGAFAECYDGPIQVCAVVCDLTGLPYTIGTCMDVFVWNDLAGIPGEVLAVARDTCFFAPVYPQFRRYVVELPTAPCLPERGWVGLWHNEPGGQAIWYVGADLDGPGGCPMTNIAPGLGYVTGWQNVSSVWGPTQALGIGAEVTPCEPVPTVESSWGRVKTLYR